MLANIFEALPDLNIGGYPLGLIVLVAAGTFLQAVAIVWFLAGRATKPCEVATWAESYRLRLTRGNVGLVRWYVRLAITLRVVGGVAGIYLGTLADSAFGMDSSAGAGFWTWVIGGWVLGALWAQRQVAAPTTGGRVASLTPRRLADYLPVGLRWAPLGTAGLAAFGTAVTRIAYEVPVGPDQPSVAFLAIGVASCGIVAGLVWLAEAHVIGQRQVPGAADVVAADEAIRTSTIHQVAGAGTAIICTIGITLWMSIAAPGTTSAPVTSTYPWLLVIGALFSWRYFTYRSWLVRRSVGTGPAPAVESSPA